MIVKNHIAPSKMPTRSEGQDGDFKIVTHEGSVYVFYKHNGEWYRTKMEKI